MHFEPGKLYKVGLKHPNIYWRGYFLASKVRGCLSDVHMGDVDFDCTINLKPGDIFMFLQMSGLYRPTRSDPGLDYFVFLFGENIWISGSSLKTMLDHATFEKIS